MAYTVTCGNIKGGCAKTTTTAVAGYLLSKRYRVLLGDADGQGNATECLTETPIREFRLNKIGGMLEAIKAGDARPYIIQPYPENPNLHLLPASEVMATFPIMYFQNPHKMMYAIKNALQNVQDKFDFILLDTPPELGFTLSACLHASDGVVAMFQPTKYCYSALQTFYETCMVVNGTYTDPDNPAGKAANPDLEFLGILPSMVETRRKDHLDYIAIANAHEDFGKYCFKTLIKRKAATGRLDFNGLGDTNSERRSATNQFDPFIKELLKRISKRKGATASA